MNCCVSPSSSNTAHAFVGNVAASIVTASIIVASVFTASIVTASYTAIFTTYRHPSACMSPCHLNPHVHHPTWHDTVTSSIAASAASTDPPSTSVLRRLIIGYYLPSLNLSTMPFLSSTNLSTMPLLTSPNLLTTSRPLSQVPSLTPALLTKHIISSDGELAS